MIIFSFMNKHNSPKKIRHNFRKAKKIFLSLINLWHLLPLDGSFVYTYILKLNDFIRGVSNHFPGNLIVFVIPRIGYSIILLKQSLIREIANGIGKGSSKMVINLINVSLQVMEPKSLPKSLRKSLTLLLSK